MNMHIKRRNYFINKEFQGRSIFIAFLLLTLGSIFFVLIFSFFSSNTLSIVYENYHLRLGMTPGILLNKMLGSQWLIIVFGGIAVAIITLFSTHRVAGPFFRFEVTLDQMLKKDISVHIALRPRDEGKDLAGKINDFNEMLSLDLSRIRNNTEQISLCCQNISMDGSGKENYVFPASELEKVQRSIQNTFSILNDFKRIKK